MKGRTPKFCETLLAPLDAFLVLFNWGLPCAVSRYFTGACPARPVAHVDGTGVKFTIVTAKRI